MPRFGNARGNRITDFFKPSKHVSSSLTPPLLTPPKARKSEPAPALLEPFHIEAAQCDRQNHDLENSGSKGDNSAPAEGHNSLAPQNDARASARVKRIITDIKKIRGGRYKTQQFLAKWTLSPLLYSELLQFIEDTDDEDLRGYFKDDFR